jgi:hypothetical protein
MALHMMAFCGSFKANRSALTLVANETKFMMTASGWAAWKGRAP